MENKHLSLYLCFGSHAMCRWTTHPTGEILALLLTRVLKLAPCIIKFHKDEFSQVFILSPHLLELKSKTPYGIKIEQQKTAPGEAKMTNLVRVDS